MSLFVDCLAEAEGGDAVGFVGNDRPCAARFKPFAQGRAIISLVAKQFFRWSGAADETLGFGTIMRFAAAQEDGKKTALSIRDCVDFRVSAAARAANRLFCFPLFAPAAERCALM